MDGIKALADSVNALNAQASAIYKSEVEEICSGKSVCKNELESLLDGLVSTCISDEMIELFKRVCTKFYYQYPELIMDYVYLYKELYEDDVE